MGVLKIFANGIELDYVNETLTLKKENNAFIQDYKVTHSSFPFLIIENANTKQALGTRDLTSVLKTKVVPVVVLDMGQRYAGELTILAYVNGHRKCDVKYGSEVLKILDKKISDVLPSISVIPGVTVPVPYQDEALDVVPNFAYWNSYPLGFIGKIFPEVDFGFPKMLWKNKYGEGLEEGDEWYHYGRFINNYDLATPAFIDNNYTVNADDVTIVNKNVPAPQLFLLGAIRLAFASIGYTIAGSFVTSDFARRLMLLSTKDNLCKVGIAPNPLDIHFNELRTYEPFIDFNNYWIYNFTPTAAGEYVFDYGVVEPLRAGGITEVRSSALFYGSGTNPGQTREAAYFCFNNPNNLEFRGSFTISVSDEEINTPFHVAYCIARFSPQDLPESFLLVQKHDPKTFNMMHPTINLGRYAPDWNVADVLNEAKKWFNLNITFNDQAKIVNLNFAKDLLTSGQIMDAGKSLALTEYNPPQYIGFVLKYANDRDGLLYIDRAGLNPDFIDYKDNENIEIIESKFKIVDRLNGTANLTEIEDKDGTGLMIYDPGSNDTAPFIADNYNDRTLGLSGQTGIYATSFKTLLQFRLYGSQLQMEGPFTEHQLQRMDQLQKIAIDNQAYVILSTEFKPTAQGNYLVTLELQTITF